MVFAIRPSYNDGNDTPVKCFGIISSILLSVALFPQYIEIYRHKEVIGISITFMVVDLLGGVFSDLSLAFKDEFDIIASISGSLVVVLDGVVIIAAAILNPRAARRRRRLAALDIQETAISTITGTHTAITPTVSATQTVSSSTDVMVGSRPEWDISLASVSGEEDGKKSVVHDEGERGDAEEKSTEGVTVAREEKSQWL